MSVGEILFGVSAFAFVLIVAFISKRRSDRKRDEKQDRLIADIKANPQNYYQYEGGTKPNPPPPDDIPE